MGTLADPGNNTFINNLTAISNGFDYSINAQLNYWGVFTADEIGAMIFYPDTVVYDPWLGANVSSHCLPDDPVTLEMIIRALKILSGIDSEIPCLDLIEDSRLQLDDVILGLKLVSES